MEFAITTLDWTTMKYTTETPSLIRERPSASCVLIKDVDGMSKVAIIGGKSKGMEFWNPLDGSVELVTAQLPAEDGSVHGLMDSYVIPINGGTEFILYSGDKVSHHLGIWRYTVAGNKWERIQLLLEPRSGHAVVPVTGMTC